METVVETANIRSDSTPFGKVMGVVEDRSQFRLVCEALSKLGIPEVDALRGTAGIRLLDTEQESVSGCFLGDMEAAIY